MDMVSHGQRVQVRTCNRKMRFRDQHNADVQVAVLKFEGKARAAHNLHSYRCPYCDGWHIGHVREGKKAYAFR